MTKMKDLKHIKKFNEKIIMERFILNLIVSYLKYRGFFFKIERKKDHPIYKDNFIKYELYEYTENNVENFKKETLNK